MSDWFIPDVETFSSERAFLYLGLRRALRYYRELVVPGIGGVRFVRQLSWGVAGIQLAQATNSHHPASRIANGIEALACKSMWRIENDEAVRGVRAFNRHPDLLSFKDLTQRRYYVQTTFRQSAVAALAALHLSDGGSRFNSMSLSTIGEELADAFLDGDQLRNSLTNWIEGNEFPRVGKRVQWIARYTGGVDENRIVRECLRSESEDGISSPARRRLLIEAFGNRHKTNVPPVSELKNKVDTQQRLDIETAEAFDTVLSLSRNLVHLTAERLKGYGRSTTVKLASPLRSEIELLKSAASNYLSCVGLSGKSHADILGFAQLIANMDRDSILGEVLSRDGAIVSCIDKKTVSKGELFDRRQRTAERNDELAQDAGGEEDTGSEDTSTTAKIAQLFSLWRSSLHE